MSALGKLERRARRRRRVRARIFGSPERPRLSVFRSNHGVGAQLIDDYRGHTLASVTWTEAQLRELSRPEQARRAGELLAERAKVSGIQACVLDRRGYKYHGLVKEFAEGARGAGLAL